MKLKFILTNIIFLTSFFAKGQNNVKNHKLANLPDLTADQLAKWNFVKNNQLGVMGNDFNGRDEVGTAPVERPDNITGNATDGIPDVDNSRLDIWFPNIRPQDNKKAYKQTMIGTVTGAEQYFNTVIFPDFDIDFYVKPDPLFRFLINENPAPLLNGESRLGHITSKCPVCPDKFGEIEAEIDLKDKGEQFAQNFLNGIGKTKKAGFYGIWQHDNGHCRQPEIHPAEQVWWQNQENGVTTYNCNLFCDYSKRFFWKEDMDDNHGIIIKPWAEPPVKGLFAIPFELKPGSLKLKTYKIFFQSGFNINYGEQMEFDNYKIQQLVIDGNPEIIVYEPDENNVDVSFKEVGKDRDGTIKGFLVIRSVVGKMDGNDKKEPGHIFFEVKEYSSPKIARPGAEGDAVYKVILESIECVKKNDFGPTEDLFGMIKLNVFATPDNNGNWRGSRIASTATANILRFNCTNLDNTLWCYGCKKDQYFFLKEGEKKVINSSMDFRFSGNAVFEFAGKMDESDSDDCSTIELLGEAQKKIVVSQELETGNDMLFSMSFARTPEEDKRTIIKANFRISKVGYTMPPKTGR